MIVPSQPTSRMPAMPAISPADHVDADLDALDRHAGEGRGLLVAADRERVAPPRTQRKREADERASATIRTITGFGIRRLCRAPAATRSTAIRRRATSSFGWSAPNW